MKRLTVLLAAALAVGAQAQQGAPSDVPRNHWAYEAVDTLFRAGLLKGYPDGTFKGSRPLSRYEMAAVLTRVNVDVKSRLDVLISEIEKKPQSERQDQARYLAQLKTLRDEVAMLKPMRSEIDMLAMRIHSMREQLGTVRKDLSEVRSEIDRLKK